MNISKVFIVPSGSSVFVKLGKGAGVDGSCIKGSMPNNFVDEMRQFATSPFRPFEKFAEDLSQITDPQQQNFVRNFAQIKSKVDPFVWAEDFVDITRVSPEKQQFALELAAKRREYPGAIRSPLYNPPQTRPNDVTGIDIVNLVKVPEDRRQYIAPLLNVEWLEDLHQVFRGRHIAKILTETEPKKINHAVYDLLLPGRPTSVTYAKGRFGVDETVEQLIDLVNTNKL